MNIKIGCSGFQEARSKYYEEFPLVEVQQTFFQPPPIGTAMKWRNQSPSNFEFTIKAWQLITHDPVANAYRNLKEKLTARQLSTCGSFQPTRMVFEAWNRTEAVANALGAKVIVFQGSKSFKPTPANLKNFKNFFRRINHGKYKIVWEPNGRWPQELVKNLCEELNLVYTSDPFAEKQVNVGPIHYYRLRGKNGFRSRYNENDFAKLKEFNANDVPSYFIFNNASMLFDARNFVNSCEEKVEQTVESNEVKPIETNTTPDETPELIPETKTE